MEISTSKGYRRFAWITLVLIFLVIIAGSVVRTTGSGMGCPDWPKCFGKIIPPTCACELPDNYKEHYGEYRVKKAERFANLLESIGFEEEAEALRNDPNLSKEEDFNATKTWFEYVNRLVGFLAGNAVLILLIWTIIRYRKYRKLLFLTFLNLVLMGFEAWFGSIVVATNLVPWTITLHMFFALVIVGIQVRIILLAKGDTLKIIDVSKTFKRLFVAALILTFIQIIMGSQVRQEVDFMVKEGMDRAMWIDNMLGDFYFHRSFSWALLILNGVLWYMNYLKNTGIKAMNWIIGLILIEFITGILFSYAGMPAFGQPVHLLSASVLLGIQFYVLGQLQAKTTSTIE
ncbi:MAG: COX15/CtaA family protein [Crocinitomicaceae bacterium]|nr:COX15/CtaA family protein [Crocinitomicaceae bacterium]